MHIVARLAQFYSAANGHHDHQWLGAQQQPEHPEAKLCIGLGIGGAATGEHPRRRGPKDVASGTG